MWPTSHQHHATDNVTLMLSQLLLIACFNVTESGPVRSHPARKAAREQPLHLGAKLLVQEHENSSEVWGKLKPLTLKIVETGLDLLCLQKQLTANFAIFISRNNVILLSFPVHLQNQAFCERHMWKQWTPTCGSAHFRFLPSVLLFPQSMEALLIIFTTNQMTKIIPTHPKNIFGLKKIFWEKQNLQCTDNLYTQLLCLTYFNSDKLTGGAPDGVFYIYHSHPHFQECNALYDFCVLLLLMCSSNGQCYLFIHYEDLWVCMWCYTPEVLWVLPAYWYIDILWRSKLLKRYSHHETSRSLKA